MRLEQVRREGEAIAELARILRDNGGTGMELLDRNPVLGGARIRFEGDQACLNLCQAYVRRQGWRHQRMAAMGAERSQMTVNLPVTPTEVQRALAAPSSSHRSLEP